MKILKNSLIVVVLGIIFTITAQSQGINYKALIKDGAGNVVASDLVAIQFQILQGTGLTNVYQESHTPTTDANGIAIVNIGEGTTSDDFSTIDWGSDDHYLNVQIDTDSGLVDMGTTQFKAVPYALSAANVSGLEAIDEGNGVGWSYMGRDPLNYGNIGNFATDMSYSYFPSDSKGATGDHSVAIGGGTTASGYNSTAIGGSTTASGDNSTALGYITSASGSYSTAMGYITTASGPYSTATGRETTASGYYSTALGHYTTASAYGSSAIGYYNIGGGEPTYPIGTDPLFEIGNGNSSTPSNALTVLKNGTITAPSLTNTLIDTAGDKALITKEYVDSNAPTGLEAIDEGNGIGWRIKGRDPANYGDIGYNAVDLSYSSSSSPTYGALGWNSTAMGNWTKALESYSTAMGLQSIASGYTSTAMGAGTEALGDYSTAMGNNTTASGNYSTAVGYGTTAQAYGATALGTYNIGSGNSSTWVSTDPLFEIGNGLDDALRSNALTVLKNGKVGIGTAQPYSRLHIKQVGTGYFNGLRLERSGNTNWWSIQTNYNNDLVFDYNGTDTRAWLDTSTAAFHNISDRRLKQDITSINTVLDKIMQLKPVTYRFKTSPNAKKLSYGLIAQEVNEIYPEFVSKNNNMYGVAYHNFSVINIRAIQEQQKIIEDQQKQIDELKVENSNLKEEMENRLSKIEATLNQ